MKKYRFLSVLKGVTINNTVRMGKMNFVDKLIKYYIKNFYWILAVAAMGYAILGFVAMLMFIIYSVTYSILITRIIAIIVFVMITTIPLWFSNRRFVNTLDSKIVNSSSNNKRKHLIEAQIISSIPVLIISIMLSMFVAG
jgi:hypothetical protein